MSDTEFQPDVADAGPFTNPRPFLLVGMASAVVGLLAAPWLSGNVPWLVFLLLLIGALAAGGAVTIRPGSPLVLGIAAFIAFLLSMAFGARGPTGGYPGLGWDSAQLLCRVLMLVAAVAMLLVLLPPAGRRVAASALILYHFGGIATAVTSPQPNWVAQQMWAYVYQPYLEFMYLTNAYHFYAPEPGPATIMWFCIEYEPDAAGTKHWRWVKLPDIGPDGRPRRPDGSPLWPNLEYTRRLSLVQAVENSPGAIPNNFDQLKSNRFAASQIRAIPTPLDIPLPVERQYYVPADNCKRWLSSYVRRIAGSCPCPETPELRVTGVKVYRAVHMLLNAPQMAAGTDPYDDTLYWAYFFGDYEPDGRMKMNKNINDLPDSPDPFLYWLIPIMREPSRNGLLPPTEVPTGPVKNYVYVHAGVQDRGELP